MGYPAHAKYQNQAKFIQVYRFRQSISTGTFKVFKWTVPANKRWRLTDAAIFRDETGDNTIYLENTSGAGDGHYLSFTAASRFAHWEGDVFLNPGDEIWLSAGSGTSGAIYLSIYHEEEDWIV